VVSLVPLVSVARDGVGHLGLEGRHQHAPGSLAGQLVQIGRQLAFSLVLKRFFEYLQHGGVSSPPGSHPACV